MKYEVIESKQSPDEWRVEAINYNIEGEVYGAIFFGPDARSRAEEYAAWKSAQANPDLLSTQLQRQ